MHCPWCHNPETYRRQPQIQVFPGRCIGCGACVAACRQGAHEIADTAHIYRRERCVVCGECVETCYAKSLVLVGETRTAASVVAEVLADRPFYRPTGGVTISGGEPLVQVEFTPEDPRALPPGGNPHGNRDPTWPGRGDASSHWCRWWTCSWSTLS